MSNNKENVILDIRFKVKSGKRKNSKNYYLLICELWNMNQLL